METKAGNGLSRPKIHSIRFGGKWIAVGVVTGIVIPLILWVIIGIILPAFLAVPAIEMHQDFGGHRMI